MIFKNYTKTKGQHERDTCNARDTEYWLPAYWEFRAEPIVES
ncbi:MAG: hypothetical protein QMB51_00240 [Patescibacteria group bacterium]